MNRVQRSGFTLIELMIVIGIIAILVAVMAGVLLSARDSADVRQAKNFLNNAVSTAMQKWQEKEGKRSSQYPDSGRNSAKEYQQGNRLLYKALVLDARGSPYIDISTYTEGKIINLFYDPWGNPYVYRNWNSPKRKGDRNRGGTSGTAKPHNNKYDVISAGPDGEVGTGDDIWNGQ